MTGMPRPARLRPWPAGLLAGLVLLAVVACGGSDGPEPTGPAASGVASGTPGTGSPAASGPAAPLPTPSGAGEALPSPTTWPGGVVEAVMILGKADAEIRAAGADLGAAAASEDLEAMWGAADGLATLVGKLQTQVPRIAEYPATSRAAAAYEASFPDMLAGAVKLRDAITAGDARAMEEGSVQLAIGINAYENARAEIGPLVDQALLMQRLLTK